MRVSQELGEGDEIMEEYVREAEEVTNDEFFGESYDKEWALKDESKRETQKEIALSMLIKGLSIDIISECTGLTLDEINKLK